ncbi:uncharacterized protein EI90DRAFT_3066451 [Cantharellus anzutake]|uniref:uncharacterized protein n=1 Tax=Cantharellus anzutake TaxID=1750568 RepID=UPI001905A79A|nr:uncharacterized protein EI90DRAFT_3066451 [Cantharellus anzutake]KAF8327952.1 hypothetical protein EI90DRAFT_3066451 [Cantharellus anzutake]
MASRSSILTKHSYLKTLDRHMAKRWGSRSKWGATVEASINPSLTRLLHARKADPFLYIKARAGVRVPIATPYDSREDFYPGQLQNAISEFSIFKLVKQLFLLFHLKKAGIRDPQNKLRMRSLPSFRLGHSGKACFPVCQAAPLEKYRRYSQKSQKGQVSLLTSTPHWSAQLLPRPRPHQL